MKKIVIPADVPKKSESLFLENYKAITKETENLFLFAADQKIEHLNKDFYGPEIPKEVNNPEHIFSIAQHGNIGALATQLGLIAQYAKQYPDINYIAKLNAKTDITQIDPISEQLWSVENVIDIKQDAKLHIRGVGYTIYLGSEFESQMLHEAAEIIHKAHYYGLVTILWIYPRGKAIKNEHNAELVAGAAGVAAALGADFAKINPLNTTPQELKIATEAAGNTKVICSGGPKKDEAGLLKELYEQMNVGKTAGCAIGRNIFQRPLKEAVALTKAISAIVYENKKPEEALKIFE